MWIAVKFTFVKYEGDILGSKACAHVKWCHSVIGNQRRRQRRG